MEQVVALHEYARDEHVERQQWDRLVSYWVYTRVYPEQSVCNI